jgi:hypothetical protein
MKFDLILNKTKLQFEKIRLGLEDLEIQRIDFKMRSKIISKTKKVSKLGLNVPFKIKNLDIMAMIYFVMHF